MSSFGPLKQAIFDRQARKQQYQDYVRGLNAYDRHKKFLNDYNDYYGKQKSSHQTLPTKTDEDTLREGYRFIRTEEDDVNPSWEQRLVKRYYDKLFKECAEKLYYKKQKEKEREELKQKEKEQEELKRKENEKHRKKRGRSDDDNDDENVGDIDHSRNRDRRKGKKASTSVSGKKTKEEDDEDFDAYLEGMFP